MLGGDETSSFGEYNLYVAKTPSSQLILVEEIASFNLPTGTFRHSSSSAKVSIEASLADGRPLPDWLSFDGGSGRFTGKPPAGTGGAMDIKVMAKDDHGNVVFTQFLLHITEQKSNEAQTLKQQGEKMTKPPSDADTHQPVKDKQQSAPESDAPEQQQPTETAPDKGQPQGRNHEPAAGRLSLAEQFRRHQQRSRNAELVTALQRVAARRG